VNGWAGLPAANGPSTRVVRAVRAARPPVIDGRLDDDCWILAPLAGPFTQRDPDEGQAPTQRTEVRFLYDDEALKVRVPTLVIWGLKDTSLLPGCAEGLERWVPEVEVQRVDDGSHWIVYEKPALISEKIRAWLG